MNAGPPAPVELGVRLLRAGVGLLTVMSSSRVLASRGFPLSVAVNAIVCSPVCTALGVHAKAPVFGLNVAPPGRPPAVRASD